MEQGLPWAISWPAVMASGGVRDTAAGTMETFLNLTLDDQARPSPRTVNKVLENESRLVRVLAVTAVPEASDDSLTPAEKQELQDGTHYAPFSQKDAETSRRSVGVKEKSGDGSDLTRADFTTGPGLAANKQGLYALERLFARDQLFNLLIIPPYSGLDTGSGDVDAALLAEAAAYCEKRRAFLLVDSHSSWRDKTRAINGKADGDPYPGLAHKNAAILFPRLI
jgi:hypothetical protein